MGFTAASLAQTSREENIGSLIAIDRALHDPIIQDMVILRDSAAAQAFAAWILEHPEARAAIVSAGYFLPESP